MRTLLAIERADVCLMMIDATEGVTDQDAKIAGEAHEAGKGVIIVVNKWDEVEKETGTLEKYKQEVYDKLKYLSYAPIIFISAKTGQRVHKLFDLINYVAEQNSMRISTSVLNCGCLVPPSYFTTTYFEVHSPIFIPGENTSNSSSLRHLKMSCHLDCL